MHVTSWPNTEVWFSRPQKSSQVIASNPQSRLTPASIASPDHQHLLISTYDRDWSSPRPQPRAANTLHSVEVKPKLTCTGLHPAKLSEALEHGVGTLGGHHARCRPTREVHFERLLEVCSNCPSVTLCHMCQKRRSGTSSRSASARDLLCCLDPVANHANGALD